MVTTKITMKPHLAEYLTNKYPVYKKDAQGKDVFQYVQLPDELDLYHTIWNLLETMPKNGTVDLSGNVVLALPNRRAGKDPESYNYLGQRSIKLIEKRTEVLFFSELRVRLDDGKQLYGEEYSELAHEFLNEYKIESISHDALIKDFYRWRNNFRRRTNSRRNYQKK